MSCRKYRDALVALARREGEPQNLERARAHVETCATCRRRFDEQLALTVGLRDLAEAARAEEPSEALEGRLLAKFDEHRAAALKPALVTDGGWLQWWPAAAAAVLAVGAVAWFQIAGAPHTPEPDPPAPAGGIIELSGFQQLPQAVTLPDFDNGEIVRTEIAVAALPVYGVGIPPDAGTAAVKIDLLVGQDGRPRMIRLVTEESQDSRSK
jgi:hypothetical protein